MVNGRRMFKGSHIVSGKQNIDSIKVKFIDKILEKLDEKIPDIDSNVIFAFGVLGKRPISFLSVNERESWGNEKLEVLIKQYGEPKTSKPTDEQPQVTIELIMNGNETRAEWSKLKETIAEWRQWFMKVIQEIKCQFYGAWYINIM